MVEKIGAIYQRYKSNILFEFIGYAKRVEDFGIVSILAILRDIYTNDLIAEEKYEFETKYNYIRERE